VHLDEPFFLLKGLFGLILPVRWIIAFIFLSCISYIEMVLNDNQKIGIGLISLGLVFIFLGILLLIDAALIAIGTELCCLLCSCAPG
jgi:hypothetical protein